MPIFPGSPGRLRDRQCCQSDSAEIRICDVVVTMTRNSDLCVPAEFSAYIPRAEIRRRYQNGQLSEEEIILSSITMVHSPRHRPEHRAGGPTPAPPEETDGTVSRFPEHPSPPAALRPARHRGEDRTWNGSEVAPVPTGVPRIRINSCG